MSHELRRGVLALALLLSAWGAVGARTVIHVGTVAPKGTPWHDVLVQIAQDWGRITDGEVKLVIHAGGSMGDELDLVKKMRIRQLQAVAVSGVGLYRVEKGASCFQIPMMFETYEELDYVTERIAPELEKRLEAEDLVVLNWGDAGWVHFFTRTPARTPADLRKLKIYIAAGDAETMEIYTAAGMKPVPLALTDMLSSLQTGMIDAFDVPPLLALVNQWFPLAPNMTDVRWSPLVGATLIRRDAWEGIPAEHRPALLEAARNAGDKLRGEIRAMNDDAITAMQERDLNVVEVRDEELALWRQEAEAIYPKLRGAIIPAELFDRVRTLRDEYRDRQQTAGAESGESPDF